MDILYYNLHSKNTVETIRAWDYVVAVNYASQEGYSTTQIEEYATLLESTEAAARSVTKGKIWKTAPKDPVVVYVLWKGALSPTNHTKIIASSTDDAETKAKERGIPWGATACLATLSAADKWIQKVSASAEATAPDSSQDTPSPTEKATTAPADTSFPPCFQGNPWFLIKDTTRLKTHRDLFINKMIERPGDEDKIYELLYTAQKQTHIARTMLNNCVHTSSMWAMFTDPHKACNDTTRLERWVYLNSPELQDSATQRKYTMWCLLALAEPDEEFERFVGKNTSAHVEEAFQELINRASLRPHYDNNRLGGFIYMQHPELTKPERALLRDRIKRHLEATDATTASEIRAQATAATLGLKWVYEAVDNVLNQEITRQTLGTTQPQRSTTMSNDSNNPITTHTLIYGQDVRYMTDGEFTNAIQRAESEINSLTSIRSANTSARLKKRIAKLEAKLAKIVALYDKKK